ncbi:YfjI family protein [Saccharopolyspora gloriosae]|uniref:YfjI family protein n=1 Tax=Saccharopolyspora gloriosae TaxID=455344 RepID=UPI001FB65D66|nr:YfjI family protein [Saccharopolyspora gloriosae]
MTTQLHAVPDTTDQQPARWEDAPIPLDSVRDLPAFPTSALPGWLADMVGAVSEFTQTPPDLAGSVALSSLSTAIGGRASIKVRPGYTEPANLFLIAALPPGTRKSEVFRVMTTPVYAVEQHLGEHAMPKIEAAQLSKRIAEREAREAEEKAASDDPSSVDDATDAALRAQGIVVPPKPKLVVNNITPEKATARLIEQGGRLAVLAPEGGIISIIAGRYSGTANFDVFLSGHAGEPLDVERQGRDEIRVDAAHLTLGLVVQPIVLKNLAAITDARDKGLLGRFLYSLPTSTLGFRETRAAAPIPDEVATAYDTRMRTLVHHYAGLSKPVPFVFSSDANEAMYELQAEVEPHLRPGAAYGHMTDWAGKYPGAVARLAGNLHAAHHLDTAGEHEITRDTFTAARRLGEYFLAHAVATYDHMGTDATLDDARTILAWIERTQPTAFTRRDVQAAHRRHFTSATSIDPALAVLEDRGHILRTDPPARTGPGRKPGATYWPHPSYRALADRP